MTDGDVDQDGRPEGGETMRVDAKERMSKVRDLRLKGFPRRLDDPFAVMIGAITLQVGLHAFNALVEALLPGMIGTDVEGARTLVGHLYFASFFVFALAIPVGCFFWMRWLDWSVKNRLVATEGRFGRSPAGVVWAYFIPGLNVLKPLSDLRRLWRAESRFGGEAPLVISAWWAVTLAHLATMAAALIVDGIEFLTAASSALGILSNVLALAVLRVFWQVQERARASRVESSVLPAEGVPA